MRLFLIRHGETIDNVAQLYAGSRDSELTNHGHQQASRLGTFLYAQGTLFTHIFSSDLRRAAKTADLIDEAQPREAQSGNPAHKRRISIPLLREKDFGSLEGTSYVRQSPSSPAKPGSRRTNTEGDRDDPDFVPPESRESLVLRLDRFLTGHIWPLICEDHLGVEHVVAVVSHGITLSHLWQRLLRLLPNASISLSAALKAGGMENLPDRIGWLNTGYLELSLHTKDLTVPAANPKPHARGSTMLQTSNESNSHNPDSWSGPVAGKQGPEVTSGPPSTLNEEIEKPTEQPIVDGEGLLPPMPLKLVGCTTIIVAVNSVEHLRGLKRTRGGVGSSKHSENQTSLENFFKRKKSE